jgi:hypothetical protein
MIWCSRIGSFREQQNDWWYWGILPDDSDAWEGLAELTEQRILLMIEYSGWWKWTCLNQPWSRRFRILVCAFQLSIWFTEQQIIRRMLDSWKEHEGDESKDNSHICEVKQITVSRLKKSSNWDAFFLLPSNVICVVVRWGVSDSFPCPWSSGSFWD